MEAPFGRLNDSLDTTAVQALRESTGDDAAFVAELVRAFLDDSPAQVAALRTAIASGNAGDVRREAHTLKSNAATFGIVRLPQLCRDLENRASTGNLEGAEELAASISDGLAAARPALEALTVLDAAS